MTEPTAAAKTAAETIARLSDSVKLYNQPSKAEIIIQEAIDVVTVEKNAEIERLKQQLAATEKLKQIAFNRVEINLSFS